MMPCHPEQERTVILSVFAKYLASAAIEAGCFAEPALERSEGLNMTVFVFSGLIDASNLGPG